MRQMHLLHSPLAPWQLWVKSCRPKTLTAAFVPMVAGAAIALHSDQGWRPDLLAYSLAASFALQIGTNLLNDAVDTENGTDNLARMGPKRAIHYGLIQASQLYRLALLLFALAWMVAIPLIAEGGPLLLLLFSLSQLVAYSHSAGPYPLSRSPWCDLAICLSLGPVATSCSTMLQSGHWQLLSLLVGTQLGLLCAAINMINSLRDREQDAQAGRCTIPVYLGIGLAHLELGMAFLLPFALQLIWLLWDAPWVALLPQLLLPLPLLLWRRVVKTEPSAIYNTFLGQTALLHLLFGLIVALLLAWS